MLVGLCGILGCGKSTIAAELTSAIGAQTYLEPEECNYPRFVTNGTDSFTTHMWFRSSRVHNMLQADAASRAGATAVVDSFYDKMLHHYLGREDFTWLMGAHDPYLPILAQLAALDARALPTLDLIVFLTVGKEAWLERLRARRRHQDTANDIASAFGMQDLMLEACEAVARADGATLVRIDTSDLPVGAVVARVARVLAPSSTFAGRPS